MSTRSTTHFFWDDASFKAGKPSAIVYRHHDGYLEGAGKDLVKFIEEVKAQCVGTMYGTRFNDASYLAAKYLVYLVTMQGYQYNKDKPLDFGGVGILDADPGDIEYRYSVVCPEGWSDENVPTLYVDVLDGSEPEFLEDAIRLAEKAEV